MKSITRHLYITKSLREDLDNRTVHLDDGIPNDPIIPAHLSFSSSFNRRLVKRVTRLSLFLKKNSEEEVREYLSSSKDIQSLESIYPGLYCYKPTDSYFHFYFVEIRNRIRENEYKFLYLSGEEKKDFSKIKEDLENTFEWKKEYIPTENQKRIANTAKTNIVLGAAGTGKTDVAMHTYINEANLEDIKSLSIREDVFITYSKRLSDYVYEELDEFWNDPKNPIKKNVYTSEMFFLKCLESSKVEIPHYTLTKDGYVKENITKMKATDYLINSIGNKDTYLSWAHQGFTGMNKASIPALNDLIAKYGIDYPYLFYRGIFKGKVINKIRDDEIEEYFKEKLVLSDAEYKSLFRLLDNYLENLEESPSLDSFQVWYKTAVKRYPNEFKNSDLKTTSLEKMYEIAIKYFDFANPIRENKRYMDYYPLFKREATLLEGYRGETRVTLDEELQILYEMSLGYKEYLDSNHILDDNDLAYYVSMHIDEILSQGFFHSIIVDEFQDMTERELNVLIRLTAGEGVIHIFGDFEQTINPTFLQLENVETLFMVSGIEEYEKQILSSSFRYSEAICKELEALRAMGKKLFGSEGEANYLPLVSNKDHEFETGGNLLINQALSLKIMKKIEDTKNVSDIMFIVADEAAKKEFLSSFAIPKEYVYTVSESKGRESDFVICYHIVSSLSEEYERLFKENNSYSRATRIFYNQLYVGITRCRMNFLCLEDETKVLPYTKNALEELIAPLDKNDLDLFLLEMLGEKTNYYFRARDSFKNLDFEAAKDNLSFYSDSDYDQLRFALDAIDIYLNTKDSKNIKEVLSFYKEKKRFDYIRVLYTVLDNNELLYLTDIMEQKISISETSKVTAIVKNNMDYLCDYDMDLLESIGYFELVKKNVSSKIDSIHIK